MPSRQERRKAERDAAKRAPAKSGAAGAAGAATALANVNVNPLGDWSTQAGDPWVLLNALGAEVVKRKAAQGDRQGLTLFPFPLNLSLPCPLPFNLRSLCPPYNLN
jgi:hypothetical protein